MDRPRSRTVLLMLLGALLALGATLSAVQAGDMAVSMVLASDMGSSDGNGCASCGDDGGAAAASCPVPCPAPTLALLPPAGIPRAIEAVFPALPTGPPLHGAAAAPDPHPPRALV